MPCVSRHLHHLSCRILFLILSDRVWLIVSFPSFFVRMWTMIPLGGRTHPRQGNRTEQSHAGHTTEKNIQSSHQYIDVCVSPIVREDGLSAFFVFGPYLRRIALSGVRPIQTQRGQGRMGSRRKVRASACMHVHMSILLCVLTCGLPSI